MKNKIFIYSTIILSFIVIILVGYIVYDKFLSDEEVIEKTEEAKEKVVIKDLDITKCINGVEGVTYSNPKVVTNDYGLNPKINDDKLSITISVDSEGVFYKNASNITSNQIDFIYVNGFTKNISKVFIGEFGHDATGISLMYLMEDGTVSYTKLFKKNYDDNNDLYFTLNYSSVNDNKYIFSVDDYYNEIYDIINIYNADYSIPNGGGARTVIASLKDGSFYDLSKFMKF